MDVTRRALPILLTQSFSPKEETKTCLHSLQHPREASPVNQSPLLSSSLIKRKQWRGSGGSPQEPNPKTLYSTSKPSDAPFVGHVQERRMQDLTFSRVLRIHVKLKRCSPKEKYHRCFISTAQPKISFPTGWPEYCEVLHPGKIRHDRACFHSNKQDIESISGIPNTNQTDEDNAILQTSKEKESTQRPEHTNKARGKKEYYIITLIT